MNRNGVTPLRWKVVAMALRAHPPGSIVCLRPARVEHPRDGGMTLAVGLPVGQRVDYQMDIGSGQMLRVAEFADHYEARLMPRATADEFERLLRDTPGSSVVGMIAAGALLGLILGRSKESALTGAAIGGFAAIAGVQTTQVNGKK